MNKVLIVTLILGLVLISSALVYANIRQEDCNPDIEPQSILIEGQQYTKATPNHERPCSAPILFGGKQ